MNLPQIDQILTRAIAEMAEHELETINRLEEGDVIRFPGHGIPADELAELEALLTKKPRAETNQPSKPEKKAPEGPLLRQATSDKPKTVKNAQKPGRLTSVNKGQTVMIHQGGKRKDWYLERTTAGTYVAVAGAKMQRSKTLEGALRWLWKQSQGGMQRQITKVFDIDAIKAGNAPPEEKPMGSLTPKMPEPKTAKPSPTPQTKLSPRNRGILNALTKLIHETDTVAQNFRDIAIALEYKGSGDGPEIQKFREDLTQQYGQIHYAKLYGERIRNNAEKIAAEMGKTISPAPKQSIKLKGGTDSDLLMDIQRFATKKRKAILAAKENMESSFKGRMGDQEGKWWSIAFRDVGLEAEDKLADTLKWMASDMRRLKKEIASKKSLEEPDSPTEKPDPDAMPAAKDVAKFAAQIQNAFNRLSKTDEYSKGLTRTVRATKRRKFYAIDVDRSGWLLIAPGGDIVGIKAYGVPHYGYQYGNIYDFIKKGGKLAKHGFANVVLKPYTSAMAKEYK